VAVAVRAMRTATVLEEVVLVAVVEADIVLELFQYLLDLLIQL